jgi:anti-sigma factor RsiW
MAEDSQCPDPEILHRLVQGLMTDVEAASLEEHLEHCARCAESLGSLRDKDLLVLRLQQGGAIADDLPQGGVVEQLLRKVQALSPSERTVEAPTDACSPEAKRMLGDILGPPEASG